MMKNRIVYLVAVFAMVMASCSNMECPNISGGGGGGDEIEYLIGDFCYSDFTFSEKLDPSKTCIGILVNDYMNRKQAYICSLTEIPANFNGWGNRAGKVQWSPGNLPHIGANEQLDGEVNFKKFLASPNYGDGRAYPAVAWCASLGEGWYTPTSYEIGKLLSDWVIISSINESLAKLSVPVTPLEGDIYWGSEEEKVTYGSGENCMAVTGTQDGVGSGEKKTNTCRVRAVRKVTLKRSPAAK